MPTLAEIGSPEYQAQLRRDAEASLAATRDLALNQVGLGEQGLTQQENQCLLQTEFINHMTQKISTRKENKINSLFTIFLFY